MQRLPLDWARMLRRKRHNFQVRSQYARSRVRCQKTEHVKEQYETHLLVQNIKWEQTSKRAYYEMEEIKADRARIEERSENLKCEVNQLRSDKVGLTNNYETANQKLATALITIGGQASEIQGLAAENQRLTVEKQSLAAENQWLRGFYDWFRMGQGGIMEAGQGAPAPWQPEAEAAATPEEMALQPLQPEGGAAAYCEN